MALSSNLLMSLFNSLLENVLNEEAFIFDAFIVLVA